MKTLILAQIDDGDYYLVTVYNDGERVGSSTVMGKIPQKAVDETINALLDAATNLLPEEIRNMEKIYGQMK